MSPYIPQERRDELSDGTPRNAGELNYTITDMILYYLASQYGESSYHAYNEIMGVLECVKQEFYRKMVAPYEDRKCEKNGDVF